MTLTVYAATLDGSGAAWFYRQGRSTRVMHNRLRELRAAKGLSQADLAQALDVSRQTINAIETGKYDPSLPLAFKIARQFRMRIEDIFKDTRS